MSIQLKRGADVVKKEWGEEHILVNNDQYCGKLLKFSHKGNMFSCHYHRIKTESWYVLQGSFVMYTIDLTNAKKIQIQLRQGDCVDIHPLVPHQLQCLEDNSIIIETSTHHIDADSYRILPGYSSKL